MEFSSRSRRRFFLAVFLILGLVPAAAQAQELPAFPNLSTQGTVEIPSPPPAPVVPFIDLSVRNPQTGLEVAFSLQLLLLLTVLSLAPSIIILMTSFLRISIVLDFVKRALPFSRCPPTRYSWGFPCL